MLIEFLMIQPPAGVVNPPTSFSATTISASQINLSWTYATSGLQTEVWRDGALLYTVAAGTSTYSDFAIGAGSEYTYKLRHKSGSNYSVFTTSITRSGTPPAPYSLNGSVTTDDVSLTWSNSGNVTQTAVRVYRDGTNISGDLSAGATSYTDLNRPNGTYSYTVRNYNGVVESGDSTAKSITVAYSPPLTAPSGLSASATHSDRVALSWTNGDATASTEVYGGTSPSPTTLLTTAAAGATSAAVFLNQSTAYYFRIRHVKGGSTSSYVTATASTPTCSVTPTLSSSTSTEKISLSWTLTNAPYAATNDIGSWSDNGGYQTAIAATGVANPVDVVTYGDIVNKFDPGWVEVIGTLTYLKITSANTSEVLVTTGSLNHTFYINPGGT